MEQKPETPAPSTTPPSTELPQTTTTPPQSTTITTTPKPEIPTPQNPNPNPTPTLTQPRPAQQVINRARPQATYTTQFSPHLMTSSTSSSSSSSSSTATSTSTTTFSPSLSTTPTSTSLQRSGGVAIGVPAHQPRPTSSQHQQPAPFTTAYGPAASFNPQYTNVAQAKQNIQGIQTIGNFGSLTAVRPGGVPQQRSPIPSLRPHTTATNQPLVANQKLQGHLVRAPSMSSPSTPSPGTPQGYQSQNQPWMTAPIQGKQMHPPLAPTSYRQQTKPQTLQQRSHHPMTTVSHQQMASSQQQQQRQPMPQLHQSQEVYGQQHAVTRVTQSMPHPQQGQRVLGPLNQKTPGTTVQAGPVQSGVPNTSNVDAGESSNHILSKRSIHELVSQIDPSEKLDPEVEDILMEIAEDFVDSITAVGCSLAKHRKSTTLEAKDILLHLERNWHMTLPGFGGDEIKGYKKQHTNDIHKERLAEIKKSMVLPDTVNMKSSAGQAAGNVKGHAAKAPTTG